MPAHGILDGPGPWVPAIWKWRIVMLTVELKENDKVVGMLTAAEKQFKTGSRGYFGMGKLQIGEKRYQVQVQIVEIGSKPKPEEKALTG
jgi:hypothetical protein